MYREKGDHIITAVTEHKAVIDTCKRLEKEGFKVSYLPVGKDAWTISTNCGPRSPARRRSSRLWRRTNEIGVLQPIGEIGAIAKEKGILFHTDAVQAVGKVPFDVKRVNVHMASLTAPQDLRPEGVGALYVRRRNPGAS